MIDNLQINNDNIGLMYSRIKGIISIIQDEMDINKELFVVLAISLDDIKIINDILQFKLYYSNYYTHEEKTILIHLTNYEINDFNTLYRYIKSNILYNE